MTVFLDFFLSLKRVKTPKNLFFFPFFFIAFFYDVQKRGPAETEPFKKKMKIFTFFFTFFLLFFTFPRFSDEKLF